MDVLKCCAMFMVVLFHCFVKGGLAFGEEITANRVAVAGAMYLGELGVNLFLLASGWQGIRFKPKRMVLLVLQAWFYSWLCLAIACASTGTGPGIRDLLATMFPCISGIWWFVTAYLVLYMLSPWLEAVADREDAWKLCLVMFVGLSCIPTVAGLWMGSRDALQEADKVAWFCLAYLVGAVVRRRGAVRPWRGLALAGGTFVFVMIFAVAHMSFPNGFKILQITLPFHFWGLSATPIAFMAFGLFTAFLGVKSCPAFLSRWVVPATLGTYMLHDGQAVRFFWRVLFPTDGMGDDPRLIPYAVLASMTVCMFGVAVDAFRRVLESRVIIILDGLSGGAKGGS